MAGDWQEVLELRETQREWTSWQTDGDMAALALGCPSEHHPNKEREVDWRKATDGGAAQRTNVSPWLLHLLVTLLPHPPTPAMWFLPFGWNGLSLLQVFSLEPPRLKCLGAPGSQPRGVSRPCPDFWIESQVQIPIICHARHHRKCH